MSDQVAPTTRIQSGARTKLYSSFATNINLSIGYQGWSQGKPALPTVWIMFTGGPLEVTDMEGNNTVIPVAYAGTPIPGQYKAIVAAGSTATDCLVMW